MTGKGLDLLKEPLPLAEGERVTGVRIVLGGDLATVEGRIVNADGRAVPAAGVALFPVDQRKWQVRSTTGLARADSEGRFSMRLAPGEYLVVAWSVANEPTTSLDAYVRERSTTARRIILQPDEKKALEKLRPARRNLRRTDASQNPASPYSRSLASKSALSGVCSTCRSKNSCFG